MVKRASPKIACRVYNAQMPPAMVPISINRNKSRMKDELSGKLKTHMNPSQPMRIPRIRPNKYPTVKGIVGTISFTFLTSF
jgi:hypothetical protein